MISLCAIQGKPTKSKPCDPEVWCSAHVSLYSPSDKQKFHKTPVLKGLGRLWRTGWLQVPADLKAIGCETLDL